MPTQDYLSSVRVNRIMQGLVDPRLMRQPMIWDTRIANRPAPDNEIMGRWVGTGQIADLVADDAKAVVYNAGYMTYDSTKVPNIKFGMKLGQAEISTLYELGNNLTTNPMAPITFNQWLMDTTNTVKYGCVARREMLKIAMLTDSLNYDRLGIQMTGQGWGMFSDLKVTPAVPWTSTSATPLTDINTVRDIASQRYGVTFNRMTLSTAALRRMFLTTEFLNQAKTLGWGLFSGQPTPTFPLQGQRQLTEMAQVLLGSAGSPLTIEIDDRRFWTQDSTGATTSARFMEANKVILTDSTNDGNTGVYDFAQGIPTESIVSSLGGAVNLMGNIPIGYGPLGYVTAADPTLNSPGIVVWGVDRGFPRKHMLQASACLTVGALTEAVSNATPTFA